MGSREDINVAAASAISTRRWSERFELLSMEGCTSIPSSPWLDNSIFKKNCNAKRSRQHTGTNSDDYIVKIRLTLNDAVNMSIYKLRISPRCVPFATVSNPSYAAAEMSRGLQLFLDSVLEVCVQRRLS